MDKVPTVKEVISAADAAAFDLRLGVRVPLGLGVYATLRPISAYEVKWAQRQHRPGDEAKQAELADCAEAVIDELTRFALVEIEAEVSPAIPAVVGATRMDDLPAVAATYALYGIEKLGQPLGEARVYDRVTDKCWADLLALPNWVIARIRSLAHTGANFGLAEKKSNSSTPGSGISNGAAPEANVIPTDADDVTNAAAGE